MPKRRHRLLDSDRAPVVGALLALLALRVVYLVVCPLELVPDEAYYWDWSRQLDWGYYSKPPLIAWLIALTTAVAGDSEFMIRLPAAVFGTAGVWVVYELGRRMYDHKTAIWAALIVAVSPGMTALCLLMTIDAPFLLAWTLAVYCLWRMFEADHVDPRWLLPAVITTGAGLLTKQSTLGLFPMLGLFLLLGRSDHTKLRSPWLYLWMLGSACSLLPMLWWNHSHDWVTLWHTRAHFAPESATVMRHVSSFLEFLAAQFGILSPLICGQMLTVVAILLGMFSSLPRRERFLLCFGGIPLLGVTVLSLFQRVQPNWPVALHLPGVILLAAWCSGEISLSPWVDKFRKIVPASVAFGVLLSATVALSPFVLPSSPLAGTKLDPTGRLRGWRNLGTQVAEKLATFANSDEVLIVAATSRGPVSELAYYLPGKPRVYRWNVGRVVDSQHDVWGGPTHCQGADALIVTDDSLPVPELLAGAFMDVEDLGPVTVSLGSNKARRYRLWRGSCLRDWPDYSSSKAALVSRSDQSSR